MASGIWDSSSASGGRGYKGDPRNRPISGRRADLRVPRKEIGKSGNSDFGVAAPRFPRNSGNPGFGDILLRVGVPTSRCSVFRPADLRGAVSSDVAVALFGRVSANGARNLGFQIGQPAPRFRGRYAHRAADLHTTGGLAIFSGKFGEFRKFGFRDFGNNLQRRYTICGAASSTSPSPLGSGGFGRKRGPEFGDPSWPGGAGVWGGNLFANRANSGPRARPRFPEKNREI